MVTRSRFSTATVVDSKYLVPWLAAEGHLASSPAEPPARDYFFQYTWILPGVFDSKINLREHRYFGSPLKESARFLFDFWASVRSGHGAALQRYCQPGVISEDEVRTPMAAYRHDRQLYNTPGSVLIQHGSYQWISHDAQPNIEEGDVLLYRGIGQATLFRCLRFRLQDLSPANRAIWRQYVGVQADMLSDSVLSFNTIHDPSDAVRPEVCGTEHGWATSWPRKPASTFDRQALRAIFGMLRSSHIPSIPWWECGSSVLIMLW
jgi:hypothetical protein